MVDCGRAGLDVHLGQRPGCRSRASATSRRARMTGGATRWAHLDRARQWADDWALSGLLQISRRARCVSGDLTMFRITAKRCAKCGLRFYAGGWTSGQQCSASWSGRLAVSSRRRLARWVGSRGRGINEGWVLGRRAVKRIMLVAVVAALAFPGSAWADSGSITNVFQSASPAYPGDLGQVSATYTSTSTSCPGGGYCGWWPHGVQGPASQPCYEYSDGDGRLTYVGELQEGGSQTATESFYPKWYPTRICLYINYGSEHPRVLVAEAVYGAAAPPPPPPSPSPPPPLPDSGAASPPMGVNEARSYLSGIVKKRFGKRFTRRRGRLQRSCYRLSSEKVRCRVGWNYKRYRYSGSITLWNDPEDSANYIYSVRIRRKRVAGSSRPTRSPVSAPSCDPNYSGCLDPNATDYDCAGGSGDGPRYTGRVRVIGNDHYDLDRDGDGIACDSGLASSSRVRGGADDALALRARERAVEIDALRSAVRRPRRD